MTETAATPAPPGSGPEMGTIQRLIGVFFSPSKTFESIGRSPGWDWLLPVAIMVAMLVTAAFVINPKLDTDAAVKQTMKKMEENPNISAEQRVKIEERVRGQFESVKSGNARFIGVAFVLISFLFVAGVYHGVAAAFGASTRYVTVLAGYVWAQLPQIVKGLIGFAVAMPRDSIDLKEAETMVKSSVGAFLDPQTTSAAIRAVATSIDLFEIWGIVLGSIMLSRCTRLSKNTATITVVSLWLIWTLVKVAGATLGAAFGG
jgi:Yip1-like protein